MYGTSRAEFPRRIVCLTAETAEIAFLLGAGERVAGVPGTAHRPEAAHEKARVGGFTTFRLDKILALEPDLVLAFSDLQRDIVRDLIGAGVPVLCTNQRSFDDVLNAILLIGGALGCEQRARELIGDMQDELRQVREYSAAWPDRPRVYFEEWMDPLISGIRWVSEAIATCSPSFATSRRRPTASSLPTPSSSAILRSSSPPGAVSQSTWPRFDAGPAGIRSRP
jgi:iron complex transport system substrate-binding protein